MVNNINKILRLELVFLFLLTIISFSAFYFQGSLPDNYLSISSHTSGHGFVSYSFFSMVAAVGYYLGLWLIFPFLIYSLFYTMQYSKRSYILDMFSVIPLSFFFIFVCSKFAPDIVGDGLLFIVNENLSLMNLAGLTILSAILFLACSFRSSFKDAVKEFFVFLGKLPEHISSLISFINPVGRFNKLRSFLKFNKEKANVFVPSLLKGEEKSVGGLEQKRKKFEFTPINKTESSESEDDTSNSEEIRDFDLELKEENDSSKGSKSATDDSKMIGKTQAISDYKKKQGLAKEQEYYSIVKSLSKSQRRSHASHPDVGYFEKIISALEDTLSEFKIDGKIVNVLKGPVVDTFELELGPGVKVSKVTNSENELSMALLGAPIRIVYPMIGRATVGIEVPRNPREIIYLDEVLAAKEYQDSTLKLPVAMGKNAFGETFVVDLASMPHMLVAGATGAGKSVFINTLLVSLLAKKSPSQMKLILIDPKQLELALYATLPHLVMPVITQPKEASIALLWACQEMERRYSILKEFGVRNIEGFNLKLKEASPAMLASIHQHYDGEPDEHYELPYLVIIVDEFADLILTKAGKEIESNICRLAAKARAAGIHLVLATQRPSVDVITGLIKSNFPTRVSFRVTSSIDSRTILNSVGAEKLLGKGDMLYRHGTENLRVHSSYVDENEIEALTDKLAGMPKNYHTGAMDFLESGGEVETDAYSFGSHIAPSDTSNSTDEYFKDAVRIVVEHRTASASMLQRRMKIGYNRAANLIEEMESRGIVGPAEGSKRRKVLMSTEELS